MLLSRHCVDMTLGSTVSFCKHESCVLVCGAQRGCAMTPHPTPNTPTRTHTDTPYRPLLITLSFRPARARATGKHAVCYKIQVSCPTLRGGGGDVQGADRRLPLAEWAGCHCGRPWWRSARRRCACEWWGLGCVCCIRRSWHPSLYSGTCTWAAVASMFRTCCGECPGTSLSSPTCLCVVHPRQAHLCRLCSAKVCLSKAHSTDFDPRGKTNTARYAQ